MTKRLSPNEQAKQNKLNYEHYVRELESNHKRFPVNQFGAVNRSLIAKICGIQSRDVFTREKSSLKKQLESDVLRIGLEVHERKTSNNSVEHRAAKGNKNSVTVLSAEVENLRAKVSLLEEENRKLKIQLNEKEIMQEKMLDDGRRRFL